MRNIRDLGYTYPELANNPSNATLVASIKAQYSGPADVPVTPTGTRRTRTAENREISKLTKEKFLANITLPVFGLDNGAGGGAPYNVLIFLGDVPKEAKDWQMSKSFVGLASTLGAPELQSNKETTHTIDLSLAVQKAIELGATTEGSAGYYLKDNLHYKLGLVSRFCDNTKMQLTQAQGDYEIKQEIRALRVSLISTAVEVAQSDDAFDRWVGGFREYGSIGGS